MNVGDWQGSGTYVGQSGGTAVILSCRHVAVQVGKTVKVTWPATGEVSMGTVIEVVKATDDFQSDLALITCPVPAGIPSVEIAEFNPANAPFICLGYKGEQFFVSISRTGRANGNLIDLSAPLTGGMSGGPCLDRYNRLVGVGVGSTPTYSVAADGEYLAALIRKYSH